MQTWMYVSIPMLIYASERIFAKDRQMEVSVIKVIFSVIHACMDRVHTRLIIMDLIRASAGGDIFRKCSGIIYEQASRNEI